MRRGVVSAGVMIRRTRGWSSGYGKAEPVGTDRRPRQIRESNRVLVKVQRFIRHSVGGVVQIKKVSEKGGKARALTGLREIRGGPSRSVTAGKKKKKNARRKGRRGSSWES